MMKHYKTDMSNKSRTFAPIMETKIETTNMGGTLVSAANDYAVSKGLKVLPVCSFASAWYQRHPQFSDILERKA